MEQFLSKCKVQWEERKKKEQSIGSNNRMSEFKMQTQLQARNLQYKYKKYICVYDVHHLTFVFTVLEELTIDNVQYTYRCLR